MSDSIFQVRATDFEGDSCLKDYSIHIPDCPDWNSLVWDQYVLNGGATGSASGNQCSISASGVPFVSSAGVTPVHASMPYSGPGCNCLLKMNVTALVSSWDIFIYILQDGVPILFLNLSPPGPPPSLGLNIFPFSVLSGGTLLEVTDQFVPFGLFAFTDPFGTIKFSMTIENL
jgi:hypothetical protein